MSEPAVDWSSGRSGDHQLVEYVSDSGYGGNIIPSSSSRVWEIEEEEEESAVVKHKHLGPIREETTTEMTSSGSGSGLFSLDHVHGGGGELLGGGGEECVYVGVGKVDDTASSVEALSWTLKNIAVTSNTTMVCLVHVFPETHHIPSPLGKLPRSQVSPEQVENYMAQERGKRRDHLHKFISMCTASKVKVDTVLIESDMVAKAFLDLIPVLEMRKLVLGTTKSSLRKLRSKRGGGVVDQILQNAPESCEVKIICEGKEVNDQIGVGSASASPRMAGGDGRNSKHLQVAVQTTANESFACICFKSPRVM